MNDNSFSTPSPLRVAMIGASGIGKNHAAWFTKNGADVVFRGRGDNKVWTTLNRK